MNYKKIISNKHLRLKILKVLDFIPDRLMIVIQYYIATGRLLNLREPSRFTEKLQWYKLNYRIELMTTCSDKYNVREFVKSKGLEKILIPLIGIYEDVEKLDFADLPNRFVLKTTNGSHTNILCKDKTQLNEAYTKKLLNKWLSNWAGKVGREWSYYNIKPTIICEEYLETDSNNDLIDYKFFCFNGEPFCIYVIVERFLDSGIKLAIMDMDFNQLPYFRSDIEGLNKSIAKPKNFDHMIEIAKKLSQDFPHVRVDLYNIDGKVYFGELTFYDGSGYKGYSPDEFDFILGKKFILPTPQR